MLLSKKLDEITLEDVKRFIDRPKVEQQTVELKLMFEKRKKGQVVQRIAERILHSTIAFGNTWGGVILIGVDDDGRRTPNDHIDGVPFNQNHYDQIRDLIWSRIHPPLNFEVKHIALTTDPSKCVWIIRVPKSLKAPHEYCSPEDNSIVFKQRHGDSNRDMNLMAIEYAIGERDRNLNSLQPTLSFPQEAVPPNTLELIAIPSSIRLDRFFRSETEELYYRLIMDYLAPGVNQTQIARMITRTTFGVHVVDDVSERDSSDKTESSGKELHWKIRSIANLNGRLSFEETSDDFGRKFDIEFAIKRIASFLICIEKALVGTNHLSDVYISARVGWASREPTASMTKSRDNSRKIGPYSMRQPAKYGFHNAEAHGAPISFKEPVLFRFSELKENLEDSLADFIGIFIREFGLPPPETNDLREIAKFWIATVNDRVDTLRRARGAEIT